MIDRHPTNETREALERAAKRFGVFKKNHGISDKAVVSFVIVVLIVILSGVYVFQLRHPKVESAAASATAATSSTAYAAVEEPAESAESAQSEDNAETDESAQSEDDAENNSEEMSEE